ncbi:hypothetical protein CPB83DRAFT_862268 [Crepidotus variabilis]|uniref:Uncharacterized protein n=1 Tax=Crepidotus variabilis TaxID=179855 RepID=A0A9P6E752_9AGAR|nr:hypothetical protein CPB83DRAFT_862268 [Crepidotus variabilis]
MNPTKLLISALLFASCALAIPSGSCIEASNCADGYVCHYFRRNHGKPPGHCMSPTMRRRI